MDLKGDPPEIPQVSDTAVEHGTGGVDHADRSFVGFLCFFLSEAQKQVVARRVSESFILLIFAIL